jgi:DNA-binding CsgD family transcriptional regulator
MAGPDALEAARSAFARQAWGEAYAELSAADRASTLAPEDLERLATAAYLTGRDIESTDLWTRAHQAWLERGETERAVRCGRWLVHGLLNRDDFAQAGGWVARGQRLLDDAGLDCVERGWVPVPTALQHLGSGEPDAAFAIFEQIGEVADRFRDRDLATVSRLGRGQSLLQQGRTAAGLAFLDEAMVGVTAGEVSPMIAGTVYCAVIEACQATFDLRRAREWTAALGHWCEAQPDLVTYRGHCQVRRSEILQLQGAWPDAADEAQRARERLGEHPAVGAAYYQQGELHRLCGRFAEAEEAYRQASQRGTSPHPGFALLRLAQGQTAAAQAAIARALEDADDDPPARSRLLPVYIEIMLACGDVAAARRATDELTDIAVRLDAPLLHAITAYASGAVLVAEGEARGAVGTLRRAWKGFQELDAPYEAARVRVLIGSCCRALGDEDTAEMELDAARWVFQQLGAAPDLARVESLSRTRAAQGFGGLTTREVEVLRLVAAGKTNRAIALELVLSERTVDRHVSNILAKLGVSSRAAATAWAYQQQLVS